jgi:hypothetical protein
MLLSISKDSVFGIIEDWQPGVRRDIHCRFQERIGPEEY